MLWNVLCREERLPKIHDFDARVGQAEWQQVIWGDRGDRILWGMDCEWLAIASVDFDFPRIAKYLVHFVFCPLMKSWDTKEDVTGMEVYSC